MRSKEYIINLIDNGKHFCLIPWIHLNIGYSGSMDICSVVNHLMPTSSYGNVNNHSFSEIWQGKEIREFRLKMLNDKADERCSLCHENDKNGLLSKRKSIISSYKDECIDWLVNTDDYGYSPDAKPIYWDIRFSNLCNLKCMTCYCICSSRWFNDSKILNLEYSNGIKKAVLGIKDSEKFLKSVDKYIPYLKKIVFAGGEPLLMDENYILLKKLDELKSYDTELCYITNLMKIDYRGYDYLSIWENFSYKLCIIISLDGLKKESEYLRKGLKWETVINNWKKLEKQCQNATFHFNYTVSVFNILHLPDFHREMYESYSLSLDKININCLYRPDILSIKILPMELKKLATEKILKHIEWIKEEVFKNPSLKNKEIDLSQWYSCINYMNSDDNTKLIPKFLEFVNNVDKIRNENFLTVFPELKSLV